MALRSHTSEEILAAFRRGEKIFVLDSGTHGGDDVLIGSREECLQDVIDNEEEDVFETQGWTLNEIDEGDEPLKSIIEEEIALCHGKKMLNLKGQSAREYARRAQRNKTLTIRIDKEDGIAISSRMQAMYNTITGTVSISCAIWHSRAIYPSTKKSLTSH